MGLTSDASATPSCRLTLSFSRTPWGLSSVLRPTVSYRRPWLRTRRRLPQETTLAFSRHTQSFVDRHPSRLTFLAQDAASFLATVTGVLA